MTKAATARAAAALPPSLSAPLFGLVVAAGEAPVLEPAEAEPVVEVVLVELVAVALAAAC